jgi:hypothetical protein
LWWGVQIIGVWRFPQDKLVVICGGYRGELRGKYGVLVPRFCGLKNASCFLDLFFWGVVFLWLERTKTEILR